MDAGKTIRRAILAAKTVASSVGIEPRPGFAQGGQPSMMDDTQPRTLNNQGMYSAAAEAARALPQERGTAQQMISSLKGVKPDEIEHSGVASRWKPNDKITREDLARHFESSLPNIQETEYGDASELPSPKFKDYSTSGGANYREKLLQYEPPTPPLHPLQKELVNLRDRVASRTGISLHDRPAAVYNAMTPEEVEHHDRLTDAIDEAIGNGEQMPNITTSGGLHDDSYYSQHWNGDPNVLAHLRMSDRYAPPPVKRLPKADTTAELKGGNKTTTVPAWSAQTPGLVINRDRDNKNTFVLSHKGSGLAVARGFDFDGAHHADRAYGPLIDWTQPSESITSAFNNNQDLNNSRLEALEKVKASMLARSNAKDGPKALLLDELQSDWGQQGRERGFLKKDANSADRMQNPDAVPNGPYVDSTQKWTDLGLKRALREAATGGHSHLIWTPGEQQAERYNLSKHVDHLEWIPTPGVSDVGRLIAWKKNQRSSGFSRILDRTMRGHDEISSHVGKEVAEKLMAQEPNVHGIKRLVGDDLSVGGHGMKGYYDNILPKRLLSLAREHDPDAKLGTFKSRDKQVNGFPSLEITPKMRESILKRGFKAFARGGAVGRDAFMEGAHPDMLNADGSPRTFYHGTPVWSKDDAALGDIHEFDRLAAVKALGREPGMDAVGSWFSDRPDKAGAGMYAGSDGAVYPVHINMKNPWRPKSFEHFLDEMHIAAGRDPKKQNPRGRGSPDALRAKLIEMGHDGIVFPKGSVDSKEQQVFTPFHPEQIKSAVGNSGAFDPTERDITKATGGSVDHEPTEGQKKAGNYRKEHRMFHGLDISIENKKGSVRSGKDAHGTKWRCTLPADYGYIKRTLGADGDHVDCYIGPHADSTHAFIINQCDAKTRKFDEHKVMLGYRSEAEAVRDYVKAFSDGKGSLRMGGCKSVSIDALKNWLKNGNTKTAADHDDIVERALGIVEKSKS